MENKITYISVDRLHPHPDNPRKEIGDVTELADSIRENGIYQNLTVIPATGYYHGDYTVIIGHRRLTAAKMAGLTEVPCVITEMSAKEQLATMLLENMQRSDLTLMEQAQGMQMMLDLGETVSDISQKTGFSESTVRRRVRLCSLDRDKMQDVQGRQITMADYDKLFEVEDPDKRNELLDSIGTNNFEWKLQTAKNEIKREQTTQELVKILKQYCPDAEEITDGADYKSTGEVDSADKIKELNLSGKIYYKKYGWSASLWLYRDYTDEELAQKNQKCEADKKKEDERRATVERCENVYKSARELRKEFWRTFNQGEFRTVQSVVARMAAEAMFAIRDHWNGSLLDAELYGDVTDRYVESALTADVVKGINDMAKFAYVVLEKKADSDKIYGYYGEYRKNTGLEYLYNNMAELGYEISDEELAMLDGSHAMYAKEDV